MNVDLSKGWEKETSIAATAFGPAVRGTLGRGGGVLGRGGKEGTSIMPFTGRQGEQRRKGPSAPQNQDQMVSGGVKFPESRIKVPFPEDREFAVPGTRPEEHDR